MNRRTTCVALALILSSVSLVAADNPRLGTWKQNLEKSTYSPGPKPTIAATLQIEAVGNAEKVTVDGVDADGKPTTWSFTSTVDGKSFSTPGSPFGDTASIKMVEAGTSEMTYTTKGKVTRTTRRTVSTDGKTLTIVATGVNAKGEPYKSTAIYDKQ